MPGTNPSPTATVTTALAGGPATRSGGSGGGGGGATGRGGGSGGSGGNDGNGGNDGFRLGLPDFGFSSVSGPFFAWLGTTVGGILLFLFLVRRRREDAPSLATFVLESPTPVVPPVIAPIQLASAADPPAAVIASKSSEPRRRTRGRKAGQPSGAAGVAASAFTKRPAKGVERVFVSYRGVQMGESPDDAQPTVARLERGDEIEIIGSQEGHLNVRTPSGLTGWIPRGTVTGTAPSTPGASTLSPN